MPYEIPDSWCWTRLKSISTIINGYAFKKQDFKSFGKFKIIKIGNITTKGLDLSKCDFTDYNPGEAFTPTQGDLLIALSGATTGKMCFYNLNNESCFINQRTCIMRFLSHRFIKPALYSYFASTKTKEILDNSYGGAQPNISSEKIENMLVPLVPIKEQIRIDKTLSACLNKINEIEDRQKELLLLKNAIRNKIINLGINGKLLSSDDNYYYQNLHHTFEPLYTQIKVLDQYRRPVNSNERKERIAKASIKYPYYGATGQAGEIDEYLLDGQYVLIGEDCAPFLDKYQDKAYIVNGKFWVNNHAHILSSKCNEFLCFYLNTFDYHQYVSGTTRLKLTQKDLKRIPYPVLSEHFQKQIAQSIIKAIQPLESIA